MGVGVCVCARALGSVVCLGLSRGQGLRILIVVDGVGVCCCCKKSEFECVSGCEEQEDHFAC